MPPSEEEEKYSSPDSMLRPLDIQSEDDEEDEDFSIDDEEDDLWRSNGGRERDELLLDDEISVNL